MPAAQPERNAHCPVCCRRIGLPPSGFASPLGVLWVRPTFEERVTACESQNHSTHSPDDIERARQAERAANATRTEREGAVRERIAHVEEWLAEQRDRGPRARE